METMARFSLISDFLPWRPGILSLLDPIQIGTDAASREENL